MEFSHTRLWMHINLKANASQRRKTGAIIVRNRQVSSSCSLLSTIIHKTAFRILQKGCLAVWSNMSLWIIKAAASFSEVTCCSISCFWLSSFLAILFYGWKFMIYKSNAWYRVPNLLCNKCFLWIPRAISQIAGNNRKINSPNLLSVLGLPFFYAERIISGAPVLVLK